MRLYLAWNPLFLSTFRALDLVRNLVGPSSQPSFAFGTLKPHEFRQIKTDRFDGGLKFTHLLIAPLLFGDN